MQRGNGEPVMENGLYTHGSGYEWEDVSKKPLKRMKISARSVLTARRAASSAMRRIYPCWRSLDVGFGALCMDTKNFESLVCSALQEAACSTS